jgi:hypothetical protein
MYSVKSIINCVRVLILIEDDFEFAMILEQIL